MDGSFIENLATFYDDPAWRMYDSATGAVNVTNSREACAAAARPDVDPQYTNFCVQCLASYVDDGLTSTYVIPIKPVAAVQTARLGHTGVGLAYSGLRLDAPAAHPCNFERLHTRSVRRLRRAHKLERRIPCSCDHRLFE